MFELINANRSSLLAQCFFISGSVKYSCIDIDIMIQYQKEIIHD
ncbi:MAG: hypothetical protein PHT03_03735 [Bacilli bacterium]|nr:hypothetical protein [Bacilli bacterium]MDD4388926.1 hypothetical protein [Bacilli bacterium]